MKLYVLVLFVFWWEITVGKDLDTVDLIKKFIYDETGPTFLNFRDVCWGKKTKVDIVKELSNAGIRSTFSNEGNYSKYHMHHTLFLADLDCPRSEELLSNVTLNNNLKFPYRWLLLSTKKVQTEVLEELPLSPSSELVLATKKNMTFELNECHKTSETGSLITNRRGLYNGNYFDVRQAKELYRRRRDLMLHPLTMVNVIQDSNTTRYHLEDRLEGQHDAIAKVSWKVVTLAFQMLNATPRYIFSHRWGYKQNGSWSGMIDDLYHGRADLGTNCAVYTERMDAITYTDTIAPFKIGFIFRRPPLSYVANIFTLPFSTDVWLAVAACVTFSTASLYLASKWEIGLRRTKTQLASSVSDVILVAIGAFSQQGSTMEPKRASGRMVLWVVFVALMAVYAAYSANIVVLLQAPSNAIRTLKHLSRSKLTLAANDVDYNHFVFGMYTDPVRVEITKRVKPPKGQKKFYPINEGVEKIRQVIGISIDSWTSIASPPRDHERCKVFETGLFAFHSIVEPVYRRVEQTFHEMEKCDLVEIDFMMGFDPYVPVKKDSPYLELLKVSFKRIRESGLQSAINKRHQVPKPQCTHRVAAFSSVGLLDLRPVLALMLYGIAISILILLIEIVTYKMYAYETFCGLLTLY